MKIIDLLNKIANREEVPKRIVYCGISYLIMEHETDYYNDYFDDYFIGDILRLDRLNDEVEILEEEKKIPEKLPEEIIVGKKQPVHRIKKIEKKINEIIDCLNYLKNKERE